MGNCQLVRTQAQHSTADARKRRESPCTHALRCSLPFVSLLLCGQKTQIFESVQSGDESRLSALLVQLGPDGDLSFTQASTGNTPLHVACICGHTNIVRMLLHHRGCEVDARDIDGRTPLYVAAMGGHIDIVKMLIADPTAAAPATSPPPDADAAAAVGWPHPASVNLRSNAGLTALYVACWRDHRAVCLALLEAGAQLEGVVDEAGRSAWQIAREWNHLALADEIEAIAKARMPGAAAAAASANGNGGGNGHVQHSNGQGDSSADNALLAATHPRTVD